MIYFLARLQQSAGLAQAVRQVLWRIDPEQPIDGPWMMDAQVKQRLVVHRFSSVLVAGFAGSALILVSFGVYSILSYLILSREKEIGIRMALGANSWSIRRSIVGRGLRIGLIGAGVGLLLGVGASSVLQPYLLEVSRFDVWIYVGVIALLSIVAVTASAAPAFRASTVDPISVLRLE